MAPNLFGEPTKADEAGEPKEPEEPKENEGNDTAAPVTPEPAAAVSSSKANGFALNGAAASASPAAIGKFLDAKSVRYAKEVAARLSSLVAMSLICRLQPSALALSIVLDAVAGSDAADDAAAAGAGDGVLGSLRTELDVRL